MNMINFFDVSVGQKLNNFIPNGSLIDINTLTKFRSEQHPDLFRKKALLGSIDSLDLCGIEKPSYWEKAMSTIIFCISGQVPDRQEVLRGRQIVCQLPKWFKKKHLNRQFVFGFLPYILIGFKAHMENRFQADSNRIDDVCKFITQIHDMEEAKLTSFLCAHRGFSTDSSHILIDAVQQEKARKTLHLQMALLANVAKLKIRKIRWYQQHPTAMASSNMFPEMFIQYLANGMIPDLLVTLEKHLSELTAMFRKNLKSIDAKVASLDLFTSSTCAFLDSQFGSDWRITNFELNRRKKSPLIEIALDQVIPEIKRLIPFYGSSLANGFLETRQEYLTKNLTRAQELETEEAGSKLALKTIKAIDWFYYNQLMHVTAKALYEAAFYYVWGQTTALQSNMVAFGIDRDHSEYQNSSWSMGYYNTKRLRSALPAAILYARRTEKEKPGGALKDISFRQFWR